MCCSVGRCTVLVQEICLLYFDSVPTGVSGRKARRRGGPADGLVVCFMFSEGTAVQCLVEAGTV